jgi:hypothetical protein
VFDLALPCGPCSRLRRNRSNGRVSAIRLRSLTLATAADRMMPRTQQRADALRLSRCCRGNGFARPLRFASARTSGSGQACFSPLDRPIGRPGWARFFQPLHLEARTIQEMGPRALPIRSGRAGGRLQDQGTAAPLAPSAGLDPLTATDRIMSLSFCRATPTASSNGLGLTEDRLRLDRLPATSPAAFHFVSALRVRGRSSPVARPPSRSR